MANWSIANGTAVLKKLYPNGVSEVLSPACEAFKRLKKDPTALLGEGAYVVVKYTGAGGVSSDFAKAQANKNPANYKRFHITTRNEYAVGGLDGEWLAKAKDKGAIVKGLAEATESLHYAIMRSIAAHLYGDGTGTIGEIDATSNVATATIKLKSPTDALRFEEGMKIQAWDGSSSTLRSSGATVTIAAVDPDAGTLTATGNWSAGIADVAPGDKLILEGDFKNVASGFAAWLPTTAPTAGDNFFGVDRSVNPNRLAGVRINGKGGSIDEVLIEAANKCALYGGRPNLALINHLDFNEIALARQSYLQIKDGTNQSQLGFESFKVMGPRGAIEVVPDADCPQGKSYLLTTGSWTIGGAGQVPHIVEEDGLLLRASATADAYEMRMRAFWNLMCNAPGHNAVIEF